MKSCSWPGAVSVLLLLLGLCVGGNAVAAVVKTPAGKFKGTQEGGVFAFKGIAYAQAPVGELRWRAPKPRAASKRTVKAADYGPACLQPTSPDRPVASMDEDCLTLNVWTPGLDDAKRPVLVWIHGGGFRTGSGHIPGHVLAQNAVVVSLNYRLGPLGFFSHPALAGDVANFGLLDMAQALRWVRDNIGHFGGHPGNVTVFGVSAGGMAVNLLMVHKPAHALFHRAIAQSGYATWGLPRSSSAVEPAPLSMSLTAALDAEEIGKQIAHAVNADAKDADSLRALDGAALVNAVEGFHLPIVDGHSLREEPALLFLRGEQADVPFMTGGNSWEGSVMGGSGITAEMIGRVMGGDMAQARVLYADDFAVSTAQGTARLFGDLRYLLSARVLGEAMATVTSPAYLYYLDLEASLRPPGMPGAPHGYDAYLLFYGQEDPREAVIALSRQMRSAWLAFAREGAPGAVGGVDWGPYAPEHPRWWVFTDSAAMSDAVLTAKLALLAHRYEQRTRRTAAEM